MLNMMVRLGVGQVLRDRRRSNTPHMFKQEIAPQLYDQNGNSKLRLLAFIFRFISNKVLIIS